MKKPTQADESDESDEKRGISQNFLKLQQQYHDATIDERNRLWPNFIRAIRETYPGFLEGLEHKFRNGDYLMAMFGQCMKRVLARPDLNAGRKTNAQEDAAVFLAAFDELRPRALIAERETSLKPSDPMKTFRNAGLFARRSPADRYLETRGIKLTDDEASSLRFAPALWHWPTQSRWPAMLARVSLASGAEITTHQTFVEPDGSGKAPLGKQARLFAAGGKTIGGGVSFGEADSNREFIVAEGIESTLSAMRIFDVTAGCAALSEIGIRWLILPSTARLVRIFADHDEFGQGLAAAREAGRRWLAEGRSVAVSISPTVGEDANDVWLRKRNP